MENETKEVRENEWSLDLSGYGWQTESKLFAANDNRDCFEPIGSVLFRVLESCQAARRKGAPEGRGRGELLERLTSGGEATSKRNLF